MKILHIINSLNMGGAEKLIAETLPIFRAKGLEVEVLLLNGKQTPLLDDLKRHGITVHALGNGSVYNPKHILKIIPFLKRFDIVHIHLFPAQYFVAVAKLLSGSKAKLVFTEHSTSNRRIENPAFKLPEKLVYRLYDRIICITDGVKTVIKNHTGLSDKKLVVIENGINIEKIKNAAALNRTAISKNLSDEDKLLIQVSGFREGKDQRTVVKALKNLPVEFKLLLAGDGVTRAAHEKLVDELGLKNRVFFLGVRNDIPQLLKTSNIVILSSEYEGLSLASLEGMTSGKPFIGSDVPGIRDLVKGYGVLFPQGDDRKLAEEILKLTEDSRYYESVAEACKKRAAEYDINIMVDKTIRLYKELFPLKKIPLDTRIDTSG